MGTAPIQSLREVGASARDSTIPFRNCITATNLMHMMLEFEEQAHSKAFNPFGVRFQQAPKGISVSCNVRRLVILNRDEIEGLVFSLVSSAQFAPDFDL